MTHPLPDTPPPPGWIAIEKVSNGCGGGGASTEPGLQNWIGDSATFGDGLLTDPRFEVNFREACNLHDAAYSGAYVWDSINNKFTDFSGMTRKEADDKLQTDMDRLCEAQIPARWADTRASCRSGIGHWIVVRVIGRFIYRERIDLTGAWENKSRGWPMCDAALTRPWTITQNGRIVTALWQEDQGTTTLYGRFKGTFVTGDQEGDDRVTGMFTLITKGQGTTTVTGGRPMTLTVMSADSFDFSGLGATMGRTTQGLLSSGRLPSCSLTTTQTQPAKPTEPTTLTLTVNGKSATATTAKPTNDDPTPLVVHYGTPLNITVTANAPMPTGWKIEVRHPGDVGSGASGSGNYALVCQVKSGASSCSVTRPPPTAALTGDVDDLVYAQILAPTGNLRNVQILVNYRK